LSGPSALTAVEGRIEPTPNVVQHFDLCLQCRACETACPSGVPYGRIIEGARALVNSRPERPPSWKLRTWLLRLLFERPWRLRAAFRLLRLYQRSPLARLGGVMPARLRRMQETLPHIPATFFRPAETAALPAGETRVRVALLSGCVQPLIYPETHAATLRVLVRNGCSVTVPAAQGCCGALLLHSGDKQAARRLARRNIDAFLASGVDYVAVNAAGCGSTMKEYAELLAGDRRYASRAREFVAKVRDITELLVEIGFVPPRGNVDRSVTYQDSCHLVHAQRIKDAPRNLLRSIPGLRLVEMAAPDRCCGSAGIYNVTQPEMSRRLLDDKMQDVASTQAGLIVTANPGCQLQLELGVRLQAGSQEVAHVVELLDRAYEAERA